MDFNILKKGQAVENTALSDISGNEVSSEGIDENKKQLQFFEQRLSTNLVKTFRGSRSAGVWTRETKNEGFFQFWLQLKKLIAISSRNSLRL